MLDVGQQPNALIVVAVEVGGEASAVADIGRLSWLTIPASRLSQDLPLQRQLSDPPSQPRQLGFLLSYSARRNESSAYSDERTARKKEPVRRSTRLTHRDDDRSTVDATPLLLLILAFVLVSFGSSLPRRRPL